MAMTGGTAKLVKSGTPSGWPGAINLYVYYKVVSQSAANNTTTLSLGMYVTTPSGWYFGRWDDSSNGSYVGTATSGTNCKTFDGTCPEKTQGTRWLVENQQVTVSHNADGTKTATIYWKWGVSSSWGGFDSNSGSFNVTLTTIPRASSITSASAVTLGNNCSVKWTPNATSFRYKLKFSMGNWSYTTGAIHPNTTSAYTYTGYPIPLDAANQIPNATTGTMTVTLYTYSDSGASAQIGSASSQTFTVTVPNNSSTKPTVTISSLAPVHSLGTAFSGVYVQGKSKVKATVSGSGKYGASVSSSSYTMTVEGKNYGSSAAYTSAYLTGYGSINVTVTVKDSRGFTNTATKAINVIAYSKPKLQAASGESKVICARCDANGNLTDSGTYLKIKAKRVYSKVTDTSGVHHNTCRIQYRYASEGGSYGAWTTILAANASGDDVNTGALLGSLSVSSTYIVQIGVVDAVGESVDATYTVLSEAVFMHRKAGGKGLGLGKYCEEDNMLDVAWNARIRGELRLLESGNPLADYVTDKGASGDWTYRKWNSGYAEAWYVKELGNIALTTYKIDGVYTNDTYYQVILPLPKGLFNGSIYHVSANIQSNGYTLCQVAGCNPAAGTITYRIWSSYSITSREMAISIYCVGST